MTKKNNNLLAFRIIQMLAPQVVPQDCKIHLAVWNGFRDPLDVYLDGEFNHWQSHQTKRNFERPFVLSLIKTSKRDVWLFAGLHKVEGRKPIPDLGHFRYQLVPLEELQPMNGRLYIRFKRSGRQSYLNADRWVENLHVDQIQAEKLTVGNFPGFSNVHITCALLRTIMRNQITSWKSALSSVGAVYLITDKKSGNLYVGSAAGEGGVWQRWAAYSKTGHGGNKLLRKLLNNQPPKYDDHFSFAILEVCNIGIGPQEQLQRESHWKRVLGSRAFGLNAN